MRKICFFSRGFAFNRLVRMKFYEKILPKDVEIYLSTLQEKDKINKWNLKRTKIIFQEKNKLRLIINLRRFCKQNEITKLVNLGN